MYNNKFILLLGFVLSTVSLNSCKQTSSSENSEPNKALSVSFSDYAITVNGDSSTNYSLHVSIADIVDFDNNTSGSKTFNFRDLIKAKKDYQKGIAYYLATNQGEIPIRFTLKDVIDTTLIYHLNIKNVTQYKATVHQGKCARLSGNYDASYVESDIIKWIYRQKKTNVGDSIVNNMRLYLKELNRTAYYEYITNESMPVVPSLKGLEYSISSDMTADNYYLFACTEEKGIEDFVEEMVSLKFEGAVHSLNKPMQCFRAASTSGTACILLIGINNDWSYQIVPIGLICIDDIKPSIGINIVRKSFCDTNQFIFKKNQVRVISKVRNPSFTGAFYYNYGDFQGALYYNIPFTFSWNGDVTKVIMHKSSSSIETINLSNHTSPWHITIKGIMLGIGDNYIPIEVYDACGNVEKYDVSIKTVRIEDDKPKVNIENNIYNR